MTLFKNLLRFQQEQFFGPYAVVASVLPAARTARVDVMQVTFRQQTRPWEIADRREVIEVSKVRPQ